jgi:hypothetical protein
VLVEARIEDMTMTDARADEAILDDLEFKAVCEVRLLVEVFGMRVWTGPVCTRPAAYAAIFPCCGYIGFLCAKHRRGMNGAYPHCGREWRPIQLSWSKL